ncbi:MAG: HD domain-containing protein [Elusimicrobiales bacterium]|nr:HD domain-containing protein [Elusimicrobiales bacterium]
MKFSELKKNLKSESKDKTLNLENNVSNKTSKIHQVEKDPNLVQLNKETDYKEERVVDSWNLGFKKEADFDNQFFKIDNSINKNKYKPILFDKEKFEKVKGIYSLLLKRYALLLSKIYDGSYLNVSDDVKYLSSFIYENIDDPYFPLMLAYLTPSNYVISHSINVAIISGMIAKSLNIDSSKISKIIIASLCIDVAMPYYKNLYSQEKVLTNNEKKIIEMHVSDGVEIVEKIFVFENELKEFVSEIVLNSHERFDGSGYQSKKAEELDIFSQIVAISDFYEALTHPRSWRKAIEESYAIELITSKYKKMFAPQSVKGLISSLGMYPPGSLVKLSTGEIAKVIFINKDKIFRPVIEVLMNNSFEEIEHNYIDLLEYPLTSVESYVKYKDLENKNLKFKTKFELEKLWIEW